MAAERPRAERPGLGAAPPPPCAGLHAELLAEGVAVRDGFLSPAAVQELLDCAQRRRERGDFAAAQIGAAARLRRREDVRGDSTCWLEEPLFEAERRLYGDIEALRQDLNREAFLGLAEIEWHYACYPPGRGYARHVDQLLGRDTRRVSLIVYLNQAWDRVDGGELRVFNATGHRDIEPVAGRLVCFLSEGREHAVLTTQVERWSIAGWLRCRPVASR